MAVALAPTASAEETLTTDNYRAPGGALTGGDAAYEYAPTIIVENGVYRMWYCAQDPDGDVAGDDILYAESSSAAGPFTGPGGGAPTIVFEGRGDGSFDGQHTCDPSVVKADDGTYYLYYGAAVNDGETSIGVARSSDGLSWERMTATPIITASHQVDRGNDYGAGQPSVIIKDGLFYLIFTDTTGAGTLPNGAGQFAWRSADPTFATGTEVFTGSAWQPHTQQNSRSYMVANAFSADWQYSDELSAFVIAHNNDAAFTTLTFLGEENLAEKPYAPVNVDGAWVEGPGIVSLANKHSVDDGKEECGRVPFDLIHASKGSPPQDLVSKGIQVVADDVDCGPTQPPTDEPSEPPTDEPSQPPTDEPTEEPTPSETPSDEPTEPPSDKPTPSETPSDEPTDEPSESPSGEPTEEPSNSETPAGEPTQPPADSNDGDKLPDTGANAGMIGLLGAAGLLVAAGSAALTAGRRRRGRTG
ncbi:LPXTG cell wall anchor domain-containing protein [Microlunatus speluncae]|uniref:LPXTG cell wall anchor domain-containing protein n=1 Tax=Microlunatus speluncae TaxID=2594267 RepID=UPI0013762635|nr:LPXTG cell wall anchor domain-containing protein [Microlunatus speluncae]